MESLSRLYLRGKGKSQQTLRTAEEQRSKVLVLQSWEYRTSTRETPGLHPWHMTADRAWPARKVTPPERTHRHNTCSGPEGTAGLSQ